MSIKERFAAWVKRHIIDDDPYDDESHAATRYKSIPWCCQECSGAGIGCEGCGNKPD